MSREWKPGDVAMVTFAGIGGDPETAIGICYHGGPVSRGSTSGVARWRLGDGTDVWSSAIEARPLVVIDPEDREAVERLADYLDSAYSLEYAQQRLREYANPKPPKPDEPQGLGAVVEDDGEVWVRTETQGAGWCPSGGTGSQEYRCWADFSTAVRVLSPGVEVDQ